MVDGGLSLEIGITGLCCYGLLLIVSISSSIYNFVRKNPNYQRTGLAANVRRVFRGYILTFAIVRMTWIGMRIWYGSDNYTFGLNRFGAITYLTAFTLIIFYWAEGFHKNYYETRSFLPRLGIAFVIFNVLLYLFQGAIIVYLLASKSQVKEGNRWYDSTIITDVVLSALMSIGFFIYGWLLFFITKNSEDGAIVGRDRELFRILIITLVFTACFSVRVVVFAYRPISGHFLPDILFYFAGYFVPDTIPSILQIYITETSQVQEERDTRYIDSLYATSDHSSSGDDPLLQSTSEIDDSPMT
eukprot:TRINITY_DN12802_c0_g1_i1.p1 TRINITY_DN12802_c0_g1~~TRINITY_DN12802_c0_g1_i1.p1  ORF type:complete len:301 (-),score=38.20 TRINITY_DN12802_c0_g1_i1:113-1015(-)